MAKDHSDNEREETRCRHIGYYFRLAARVLLYASSHRQDNTYYGFCYTSRGALVGNSSMGPPREGSIRRPIAPWANALTTELHLAPILFGGVHLSISRRLTARALEWSRRRPGLSAVGDIKRKPVCSSTLSATWTPYLSPLHWLSIRPLSVAARRAETTAL